MNYEEIISKTARSLKPSGIRKFFDIVSEMPEAVSLGVGEPDFDTPWPIRDYAIKSIQKGYSQYTSNMGLISLRREIEKYLSTRMDVKYSEDEILVTVGASEAIDVALRTIINPDDEVLIPDPSFVCYEPIVTLAGGIPVGVETKVEDEFKLTLSALEKAITPRTKAIILSYPNNPTGAIMTREDLEAIAPIIVKHNLVVISDEIYAELTYGDRHVSIAAIDGMRERTILVSGFSKSFAMTGWRLGYTAAPKEIIKAMLKIHQYAIMCAPSFSQYAGYYALVMSRQEDFATVADMREQYDRRRRFMVNEFNDMGLKCFVPRGAFYVFPSVLSTGLDGQEFATQLLYDKKVAVVPGDAFGSSGKYFIRCSYATSLKNLQVATSRIREFVKALKK